MKKWIFSGFTLCLVATNINAAETVIYQFDSWTVAVTPGRSTREKSLNSPVARPSAKPDTSKVKDVRNRQPMVVQPISFNQEDSAPEPEDLPPLKAASEAIPESPLPLPPAPAPLNVQLPVSTGPAPVSIAPVTTEHWDLPEITPRTPDGIPGSVNSVPQTALYRDIYVSIPFSRVEYNAYPSYRHDATMEILFNKMRPTVIQRGSPHVSSYDPYYGYGSGGWWDPPYYPFSYGLRIHRSR